MSTAKNVPNAYFPLCDQAMVHPYLHHYTSLDKFKLIISGEQFLLNRLDQVSDKAENAFLPEFWRDKIFVCCFTHSTTDKERFWSEYAKGNGVRISLPNEVIIPENFQILSECGHCFQPRARTEPTHKGYSCAKDWGWYDISKLDIEYISPNDTPNWVDRGNALIKNCYEERKYDWEEETRIRVALAPIGWEQKRGKGEITFNTVRPWFTKIYMKMSPKILRELLISVPEDATEEFINEVRQILKICKHTENCKIYRLIQRNNETEDTGI